MAKLDRELLIEVIQAKQGVVSAVAVDMHVSRQAIYDAARRWATVQEALDIARYDYDESLLDEAELKLRQSVRDGKAWAVRYVIDKKGHKRGYVERRELTGGDGQPLKVVLTWGDNADT